MSNHYLNTHNYFHKNLIKMNKILELKNAERKKLEEKFIKAIEQNNTEIIVKIWSIIEEQNKKYKNIFES